MPATLESSPLSDVLTPEIEKFCERIGIMEYLRRMVQGVHEIFPELTDFSLSEDYNPETEGDEWLNLEIEWNDPLDEYQARYMRYIRFKKNTVPFPDDAKFLLVRRRRK